MERIRDNWSAILLVALLVGGATYIHSIEASLGTFLWIVAALAIGIAVLGPLISSATEPLWSHLTRTQREAVTGYMFVMPWLIGFLVFTFGPMLFSFYTSFAATTSPVRRSGRAGTTTTGTSCNTMRPSSNRCKTPCGTSRSRRRSL
jgi:hypothetical protein